MLSSQFVLVIFNDHFSFLWAISNLFTNSCYFSTFPKQGEIPGNSHSKYIKYATKKDYATESYRAITIKKTKILKASLHVHNNLKEEKFSIKHVFCTQQMSDGPSKTHVN